MFITRNWSVIIFIPKKYKSYLLLSALACKTFLFLIFNRENVLGNRARKYVVHQNNLFPEQKKSLIYIIYFESYKYFQGLNYMFSENERTFVFPILLFFFFIHITFHCGGKLFRLHHKELNCTNKTHY